MPPTILALTAARVLQGFGGGGLMTLSQALVGEVVPPRERGRYQGYMASVFVCSSTFGPVAGGWLTQHFGWESIFLINLPLGALAILMAFRLPKKPAGGGRLKFDFLGTGLFACFIAPLLLALEQAQRFDARLLPLIVGMVAVAVVSLVLLLRQEKRTSAPLLPIKLLAQPAIWRTDAMAVCVGASLVSLITWLPIYLEAVRGAEPGHTGLILLPLTAFIAVGSVCTGRLISKTGRTAIIPSIGLPIVSMLVIFLALFAQHLSLSQLPWLFGLIALSQGTAMPVVQMTVQILAGAQAARCGGRLGAVLPFDRRGVRDRARGHRAVRRAGRDRRRDGAPVPASRAGRAERARGGSGRAPADRAAGDRRRLPRRLPDDRQLQPDGRRTRLDHPRPQGLTT